MREAQIPENAEIIDAKGAYAGLGFVVIHVHGGNGNSTCFDAAQVANYFLKSGTTSLLETPMEVRRLGAKYRPTILTYAMNAMVLRRVPGETRGYGIDEYCFKEPDMYADLISDSCGIHVHSEMQQLLIHCKGINKVVLITDSRRYKKKDGFTMTCPPINDENIDYPIGEPDQRVHIIQ